MHVPVEHVTRDEQPQVLRAMRQRPVDGDRDDEKDDEVEAVEDHWKSGPSFWTNRSDVLLAVAERGVIPVGVPRKRVVGVPRVVAERHAVRFQVPAEVSDVAAQCFGLLGGTPVGARPALHADEAEADAVRARERHEIRQHGSRQHPREVAELVLARREVRRERGPQLVQGERVVQAPLQRLGAAGTGQRLRRPRSRNGLSDAADDRGTCRPDPASGGRNTTDLRAGARPLDPARVPLRRPWCQPTTGTGRRAGTKRP